MAKKAQAAMEFLMTYGWAILVVLAAIGALAYFGVLSPEKFLPEKCTMSPGIDCSGFDVKTTSAVISLRNGMGKDLLIQSIRIGNGCCIQLNDLTSQDCNGTQATVNQPLPIEFPNGESINLQLTGCTNGAIGDRFKGNVIVRYTEEMTGINKLTNGDIIGRIKE